MSHAAVATVAQRINQLPWETWVSAEQTVGLIDLPPREADKVLRAARRKGTVTVRRTDTGLLYKRVRLHPHPCQRREVMLS